VVRSTSARDGFGLEITESRAERHDDAETMTGWGLIVRNAQMDHGLATEVRVAPSTSAIDTAWR